MRRGDIYWCYLPDAKGHIQTGLRPVVVVQNNIGNKMSDTTIVAAITSSSKKMYPTHLNLGTNGGLSKRSTVLCEQIFTVNQSQLETFVGHISNKSIIKRLDNCLRESLGLKEE